MCAGHADDQDRAENELLSLPIEKTSVHSYKLSTLSSLCLHHNVTIMLSFLILSSSNPHAKKKKSQKPHPIKKKHSDQPIGHHQPPQPLWLFVKKRHVVEASNDPKTKAYCGEPEAKSITMGRCLEFSSWITSWEMLIFF